MTHQRRIHRSEAAQRFPKEDSNCHRHADEAHYTSRDTRSVYTSYTLSSTKLLTSGENDASNNFGGCNPTIARIRGHLTAGGCIIEEGCGIAQRR
jgi:hypothetical protein